MKEGKKVKKKLKLVICSFCGHGHEYVDVILWQLL